MWGGGIRGWRGMERVARVWASGRKRMREEDSMVVRGEECARGAWKGELTRMERMERGISPLPLLIRDHYETQRSIE